MTDTGKTDATDLTDNFKKQGPPVSILQNLSQHHERLAI